MGQQLHASAAADEGTKKCSQPLQVTVVNAQESMHSPNASLNTPPASAGGVPLHVRIVIVISIALLMVNATLLIINVGATIDSHAQYARSYEIKRSLSSFQS